MNTVESVPPSEATTPTPKPTTPAVIVGDRPGWEPPAKVTLRPPTPPAAVVPLIATDLEPARIIAMADDLESWAAQIRTAAAPRRPMPPELFAAGQAFRSLLDDATGNLASNRCDKEAMADFINDLDAIGHLAEGNSHPEIKSAILGIKMISSGWQLLAKFKDQVERQERDEQL